VSDDDKKASMNSPEWRKEVADNFKELLSEGLDPDEAADEIARRYALSDDDIDEILGEADTRPG
jgi:hypothetical protein